MTRRRRSPGEGSVWAYKTKAGLQRYSIGYVATLPDGTVKNVTRRRGPDGERWTTYLAASKALREALRKAERGGHVDPSRQLAGAYLTEWPDGLRLAPSTVASYRKNLRLHVIPYIGSVPLASLTAGRLDTMYRKLEREGRRDHLGELTGQPLAARTVRYVHTILQKALRDAVETGLIERNPAVKAHPPSAKSARAPEMRCWTADELAAFLSWARDSGHQHAAAWSVLAMTGMRRGELLELRWRDWARDGSSIVVRRSMGLVRTKGERAQLEIGLPKSGKSRVVDLGAEAGAVLRAHRLQRAGWSLQLVKADALMFGDHEGRHLQPEHFSRSFVAAVKACGAVPVISLHGLRHTHATLLLTDGTPIKVVSERLGHSSPVVTMTIYAHVLPGGQRAAADAFDELLGKGTNT